MDARTPFRLLTWFTARTRAVHGAALAGAVLLLGACDGGNGSNTTGGGNGNGGGSQSGCPGDCAGDPSKPICDPATKTCVGCLADNDTCGSGKYCNADTQTCEDGCNADNECAPDHCNTTTHVCAECVEDSHCDAGTVCSAGQCVTGCNASQPCEGGLACCDVACVDLTTDLANCGTCGKPCTDVPGATEVCAAGVCQMGACEDGFLNCNQNTDDGCEWDETANGPCSCTPGETQACYQGPINTEGVGPCKAGVSTCNDEGTDWGPCEGQVVPGYDKCSDGVDNDCNGGVDNPSDFDGDGWGPCDGDCCDNPMDCGTPNIVNPGAFEVAGDGVDNDCDGTVDNVLGACDGALASNSSTGLDYAKAIDLCQTTTMSPPLKDKKWGVISGDFFRANGAGSPAANSRSIRTGFGSGVTPLAGTKIAVLSTGVAAAQASPNNTTPAYQPAQGGQNMGTTSPVPSDWLTANGGNFPNAPGCPDPQGGTTANDPIMLKLKIRVPTNAKSFNVSSFFYSAEYPEWVCSAFNDFYLTLLDSGFVPGPGMVANPADKNLAFYDPPPAGAPFYPIGVNLAFGNTGLFKQCQTSTTGCGSGAVAGNNTCVGVTQITGTGFDTQYGSQFAGDPAFCENTAKASGGGTGWLITSGNVQPGEIIDIRFVTWDTGDPWYDSTVLIDNFQWSLDASTPGTHE